MRLAFSTVWGGLWSIGICLWAGLGSGQEWKVPLAGNAYTEPASANEQIQGRNGAVLVPELPTVVTIYFRVDRPAELHLALEARAAEQEAELQLEVLEQVQQIQVAPGAWSEYPCGKLQVAQPGYIRVAVRAARAGNLPRCELRQLLVRSETPEVQVQAVLTDEGNMFYWGRRGPSVHLGYHLPKETTCVAGYSELTVPEGADPEGSYFMANGFAEGYMGIQVNSSTERRVLFSVWSPFSTDDPRKIPADQRVECLARGPDVQVGEFGNEGSGGQSFLRYPWKAGRTYRFLTEIRPDGQGSTVYTAWFGDKADEEWRLIASFRRPQTTTHLRGFHSFLENFNPAWGAVDRRGEHGEIWVLTTDGEWLPCTRARFTVDATGGGGHRWDYMGGVTGTRFYLRNGGFFAETGKVGEILERGLESATPPSIDLTKMPRH